MKIFNKSKNSNGEYPTKEEFINKKLEIQKKELESDRYILTYAFLHNNYWNRQNMDLEEKLFEIVGTYGIEPEMFNLSYEDIKAIREQRYLKLKEFIESLTDEQISSNIFLKSVSVFMKMSIQDCDTIINNLKEMITFDNEAISITVECIIPEQTKKFIPDCIPTQTAIKYYRPEVYKKEYVDVLDASHKRVYEDYNDYVRKIERIAEDIYLLQLNNILMLSSETMCYHFQIYHPGENNCFIASFFTRNKKDIQDTNQTSDYENLLLDETIMNDEYTLSKTK